MTTPDHLAALRRSFAPQRLGLMLALVGALAAVLRGTALPALPRLVPVVLIVTALGLIGIGAIRRWRVYRSTR
jgi:p-aminobenzoyl-glutamate transporter AbgT